MDFNQFSFRVRYAETDQMGVVYHGNYPQYLEMGRVEWLRAIGISYKTMEQVRKLCPSTPLLGLVTKIDTVSKQKVMEQLVAVSKFLGPDSEVVPVSAASGEQVDVVADVIATLLPEGPQFYPEDVITEESDESRMSELIREAALEGVRDELPHSIAVSIEEVLPHDGRDDMVDVHAVVYVERVAASGLRIQLASGDTHDRR